MFNTKNKNYKARVQGALSMFTKAKDDLVKINFEISEDNLARLAEIADLENLVADNNALQKENDRVINKIEEFLN